MEAPHELFSISLSYVLYGICVYGLADIKYTSKIALIQKRAIRILSKAPHNAHTHPLFKIRNPNFW